MDIFSHALLPYLLGKLFKKSKEDITALVLGGIAPDFDIFILWINYVYPNFFLTTHRGLTHSFLFGFFTAILILYLATGEKVKNRVLRYVDFNPVFSRRAVAFAFAGVVIHLFLDFVTTRGVPLFYPVETTRYSAEVFFYNDIFLTITSLAIVIFLFKKPLQKNSIIQFLTIYLVVFAGIGAVRLAEKSSAEQFFQGPGIKTYPTMNPFDWYVLAEDVDEISIFEYNGLDRTLPYIETVSRLNIFPKKEGLDDAINNASELPQVKMFEWRAYAVAINASFSNGTWSLEYYDPLRRAMFRDSPFIFRRIETPIRVKVEAGRAVIS